MRWFDLYIGLMSAVMGFAAVVAWTSGMSAYVIAGFAVLGVVLLGVMAWRMSTAPTVLLVGKKHEEHVEEIDRALDDAGFAVRSCPGPTERACPVFFGEPCPVHVEPFATVEFAPHGYTGRAAPCEDVFHVPTLHILGGDDASTGTGGARGAREVVAALKRVIARD